MTPDNTGSPMVAVIELGTTSIRMAVAQIAEDGSVDNIDQLSRAVALGKDTFAGGRIESATTEECVAVLRSFGQILEEYGVVGPGSIKTVATSAVREASNRVAFLDRIYMATGMDVEVIDSAEVSRYTYLAVRALLDDKKLRDSGDTLVAEVGGGSTEVLVFHEGRIGDSHTYRRGSLRLRRMVENQRASTGRLPAIMKSHVERALDQITHNVSVGERCTMLALGSEARFAAKLLDPDWDGTGLAVLRASALSRLANETLSMSVDEAVRHYGISYPDAETLGPSLLIYARLAAAFSIRSIRVGPVSIRDGILHEMAAGGEWTDEFRQQVVNSAMSIGRKYDFNSEHAEHVATLAMQLFEVLVGEHGLNHRYGLILYVAALLHEVGAYVSVRSHHKHSQYLICNSDIFGIGPRAQLLAGIISRYHRRARPRQSHPAYAALDREGRLIVLQLASVLRVADAIARGRSVRPSLSVEPGKLVIALDKGRDITLEQQGMQEKGSMFESVYGMKIELRRGSRGGR